MNPIIAMLHNVPANLWHPVIFLESPLPGNSGPVRHKSSMHHTGGFSSREEAVENASNALFEMVKQRFGTPGLCLENDFPWDGEGIPAMVVFFEKDAEGKLTPLF